MEKRLSEGAILIMRETIEYMDKKSEIKNNTNNSSTGKIRTCRRFCRKYGKKYI